MFQPHRQFGRTIQPYAAAICVALSVAASLRAQGPDSTENPDPAEAAAQFETLTQEFKKLGDWQESARLIQHAVDRVWRENGWDTEPDQFARRLAGEVSSIPPWDFPGRVTRMTDLVSERYQFDEPQRRRLESSIYSETGWLLVSNFRMIWDQTRETISTRAAGRPFTPEMVARWARDSEPLIADAREGMQRIIGGLEKTMTPAQRGLLENDLRRFEVRQQFMDHMRARWARGEWQPQHWGLEIDPIHAPSAATQPAEEPERRPPEVISAQDETTWGRYVRDFIERYQLDSAQRETAYSILRELESRAADYRSVRPAMAPEGLQAALSRLFEELQTRLRAIPTSAQRIAAAAQST